MRLLPPLPPPLLLLLLRPPHLLPLPPPRLLRLLPLWPPERRPSTAPCPETSSRWSALWASDVLVVLEAMKMEIEVSAPVDGTVKAVSAVVGTAVNTDDLLVTIG